MTLHQIAGDTRHIKVTRVDWADRESRHIYFTYHISDGLAALNINPLDDAFYRDMLRQRLRQFCEENDGLNMRNVTYSRHPQYEDPLLYDIIVARAIADFPITTSG